MRQTNPRDVNYIFLMHDTHYQTSWYVCSTQFPDTVTEGQVGT
jgi:hypothetical protein